MGQPHFFLSTFSLYGVHIREVQTFKEYFGSHPHHSGSRFLPRALLGGGREEGKAFQQNKQNRKEKDEVEVNSVIQ